MMNAMALAHEIWGDLWEFGRVLLIMLVGIGWHSFKFGRLGNREEFSDLGKVILIALCTVGAFCLFLFLNIEMSYIFSLIKVAPLWGTFSALSLAALVATVGLMAHQQLGTTGDEINLSILSATEAQPGWMSPKVLMVGLCISTLFGFISAWWLWLIAQGRWIA